MYTKFNFYDFAGYILPGSIVLVLLYWLGVGFFGLAISFQVSNFGQSLLFLVAAYFLGQIVQALGNEIEKRQVLKWGGWFSEQFLREDNNYYTKEFKTHLHEFTQTIFAVSVNSTDDEQVQKNKRQEIFNLCYTLTVQEGVALHTEIFNGIYSLYRGMLAAIWIGIFISGIIALKHLLWLIFPALSIDLPQGAFWLYKPLQLELGVIIMLFFLVAIRPLEKRYKRFGQHFANSVYRNFYVWYKRKEMDSQKEPK